MVVQFNAKAIDIYIWLGIWRCDGPERHRMSTVISVFNINVKFKVQHFQLVIH